MKQLLVIAGPTATGKTNLALKLAEEYNGEVVSADSRQIYKKMNIGTGKDIPPEYILKKSSIVWNKRSLYVYEGEKAKIWLYDIVFPNQDFNVSDYYEVGWKVINNIWDRDKRPIVVGGTGFYINVLINGVDTLGIDRDHKLRKELESYSVEQLQNILKNLSEEKFLSMNSSDQKNQRRLVRAIEIFKNPKKDTLALKQKKDYELLMIGLNAPKEELFKRVIRRVDSRVKQGVIKEVGLLIKKGYNWNLPSMSALGYKEWRKYREGNSSKEDVIKTWKINEQNYVKRQLTWFKRDRGIIWYDITNRGYERKIKEKVKNFYMPYG